MKIFITRSLPGNIEKLLCAEGHTVTTFKKDYAIEKSELIKNAMNADAVICLLTDQIDKEVLDNLNRCKVIANYAVGYNNIDVEYAKGKGIVVTNTPDILTDATADIAVALILACARKIISGDKIVRDNKFTGWSPKLLLGIELNGKTVGIIGAGRIGQAAAKRLKAFGTKIIYYNRTSKKDFEKEVGAKRVSLNYLVKNSDIISIHIPLSKETFHLLNKENMAHLKTNAILVNTARGEIVDEKFLINLLKKKKIHSAGFDVYEGEPKINPNLLKQENVVLLPHIGSATIEARTKMALLCADNVLRILKGKSARTPV